MEQKVACEVDDGCAGSSSESEEQSSETEELSSESEVLSSETDVLSSESEIVPSESEVLSSETDVPPEPPVEPPVEPPEPVVRSYTAYTDRRTWDEALALCQERGHVSLAVITNEVENEAVF